MNLVISGLLFLAGVGIGVGIMAVLALSWDDWDEKQEKKDIDNEGGL